MPLTNIDRSRTFGFEELLPDGSGVMRRAAAKATDESGRPVLLDREGRAYLPSQHSHLLHVRAESLDVAQDDQIGKQDVPA